MVELASAKLVGGLLKVGLRAEKTYRRLRDKVGTGLNDMNIAIHIPDGPFNTPFTFNQNRVS
jgi:hypothetical protein